ncbi:MAG: DNA mismatch repair endonuclease MutL [Methanomassiliicoccales archaeon]|nr:MAG: DNA mismatch repair endonuclease MutL [Methanomassiliicoccales archaeon]
MVGRIKVLDDRVVSQIAAGEVVERPSSVVKELVENSIDADASRIVIEIDDGGKKKIKVTDDGVGLEKEDAELAFFRHSTSKISTLRDLESITSLGFRGEALASIAAVSKVTFLTKPRDEKIEVGCEVFIEGGRIRHVKDAACNEGTTVIVEDLFYNTPARRKFLKTTRAELAKITDIVTRFALIHPQIYFKLIHNGSEIINTPKANTPLDNIIHIYGKDIAKEMLAVDHFENEMKIEGFISKPKVTRKTPSHISIFVNGRYITSKLLSSAIKEGYHNLIMKNRYPIAVISLSIHPRKVDVNVHPTKLEIKFQEEKKVYDSLSAAVRNTLQSKSLIPDVGEITLKTPIIEAFEVLKEEGLIPKDGMVPVIEAKKQVNIHEFDSEFKAKAEPYPTISEETTHIPKMTLIGQILNTYIVAQSGENILIIDQHAAPERVLFERLSDNQKEEGKKSQELLSPITIELNPEQSGFVSAKAKMLDSLGFKIEHFGGNTYQVRSVPVVLTNTENKNAVYDIIDELALMGKTKKEEVLREKAMAVVACHSAIRGGDELSYTQMKKLVESLYTTENAESCPHGRPSILLMSRAELEKKFKRK